MGWGRARGPRRGVAAQSCECTACARFQFPIFPRAAPPRVCPRRRFPIDRGPVAAPDIPPCPFEKRFPSQLMRDDAFFMSLAYNQAIDAWREDEVPVGAVIVAAGEVIGAAHNRVEGSRDPTAHAELLALTQAASSLGDWRLEGATVYVTKE